MEIVLPNRSVISIQGEDALPFLQNLVTQDIANTGALSYGLLLSPKGRVIADLFFYKQHDGFLLECDQRLADRVEKLLQLYKLRARVHIHMTDQYYVQVSWGDADVHSSLHPDPRTPELGYRGLVQKDGQLVNDTKSWIYHRYLQGVPEGALEIEPDQAIPLEYNFDYLNAISWTKGCYMGQELTARTKFVGAVRKRIFPFVVIDGVMPLIGDKLTLGTEPLAEVIAVMDDRGLLKFRYVDYPFEKGKPIILDQSQADKMSICEVIVPPWLGTHLKIAASL